MYVLPTYTLRRNNGTYSRAQAQFDAIKKINRLIFIKCSVSCGAQIYNKQNLFEPYHVSKLFKNITSNSSLASSQFAIQRLYKRLWEHS